MTRKGISGGKRRKVISRAASSKQRRTGRTKSKGGKPIESFQEQHDLDAFWEKTRKRQKMQLKLEDGKLFITLPQIDPPRLSGSGKSHVVATTGGVRRTSLLVDNFPVHIVATAFVYGYGGEPPVQWVPLIDLPKRDDDDQDDDDWTDVPLLE